MSKRKRAKQLHEELARNKHTLALYYEHRRRTMEVWKQNYVQFDVNCWRSWRDSDEQTTQE